MPSYVALLGHQPVLSQAELAAVLPDFTKKETYGGQFLAFETQEKLTQEHINRLGGSVLLAQRIADNIDIVDVPSVLATECGSVSGKVTFGLRCEGIPRGKVRELYRTCKDALKNRGIASRYIGNERGPALPVQLHDEGLLDASKGCELVILREKGNVWIGRTVAAQDTKDYTLRDMEKPVRDTTTGLLPPKLAQVLLNFGAYLICEKKKKMPEALTVFDPFCGSGVIPVEAMLRGWHVLASDVSKKAESGCVKNIEWARKTFKITKEDVQATIWKQDATKPFDLQVKPDVIVSETSLGPNLRSRPNVGEAGKIRKENEKLQEAFLRNVKATLPDVPLVLTWPTWYTMKRLSFLEKMETVCGNLGYTMLLPPGIEPAFLSRPSILYRRKDQFVGREIVLLQPSAK